MFGSKTGFCAAELEAADRQFSSYEQQEAAALNPHHPLAVERRRLEAKYGTKTFYRAMEFLDREREREFQREFPNSRFH